MNRKNLILPELLISLLFFVLAATILIQVFVFSFLLGTKNQAQTHALVEAQNLIETIKADPTDTEFGLTSYGLKKQAEGHYEMYFDTNWAPVDDGRYRLDFTCQTEVSKSGTLHQVIATCIDTNNDVQLVSLSTKVYEQGGGA